MINLDILFTLDEHNYTDDMPLIERFAARAIIIDSSGRIAMQQDRNGEYKLPGGGLEGDESPTEALCREVLEETGMTVIPESIRELGVIIERRRDVYDPAMRYEAYSYCYLCSCAEGLAPTQLTDNEQYHGYRLVWAEYDEIIRENMSHPWSGRDTRLLTLLRRQGII